MSSSKIQEYNLDPNCGFAKEDTAQEMKTILEGLNTNLSGSLTANVVKSVQHGVITIDRSSQSNTATINAVNVDKSVIIPNGFGVLNPSSADVDWRILEQSNGYFTLTNSTTVTASEFYHESSYATQAYFTVIEYY